MKKLGRKSAILFGVITLIVVARILAPAILLRKINNVLATFSDTYYAHIDDFDLSLWRGAYQFKGAVLALKVDQALPFATARVVDVSVAWREIIHRRILMDIVIDEAHLIADKAFTNTAKAKPKQSKDEAQAIGKKLFPIETERIVIQNSSLEYKELGLFSDHVEGRFSNVTATENNPISVLTLRGLFMGVAPLKAVGELNLLGEEAAWVFSVELQKMEMAKLNSLVNRGVPLTFKKGVLDVYAEVKSEKGRVAGYVKPFLKEAEVIGDDKDFKGIKHFGVEISVAFLNLFFRSTQDHVLATKFLFSYENKEFQWNMNEVITELFKNGFGQPLQPGTENRLKLSSERKGNKNEL